jgi:hypothetical protein
MGLGLAAVVGCAGAGFSNQEFQTDVIDEDYERALERLEAFSDEDVSALLDRAVILQAMGQYHASNAAFEIAERRIESLYTRSLSKEALALLANDRALDYRASGFEHAYISYYRAWNYLELGRVDDVLVEARRINERLNFRSSSCEDIDGACGHDVFLRYFSGLLFEWAGEINDAYVSYVQADAARASSETIYGTKAPADLGIRLVRLADMLGFKDEAPVHAEVFHLDLEEVRQLPRSSVVLFWENGMIGSREQVSLVIPIFEGESGLIAQDRDGWSEKLAGRQNMHYEHNTVDYLLPVSLPSYVEAPPTATRAEMHLGKRSRETRSAAELSAMARESLNQALPGILIRAIGRGLVKYFASEKAEEEFGEFAGILVNIVGVALEQADTRSWRSLPYQIQIASFSTPAGAYEGRLRIYGNGDEQIEEAEYETVEVPESSIVFLRHRTDP